jgi:hypothetical protein
MDRWIRPEGIKVDQIMINSVIPSSPSLAETSKMSFHQVQMRVNRFLRMLRWFAAQPVIAPINICHFALLTAIYEYLTTNADTWGTRDTRAICILGDFLVSLYNRPAAVIDLTRDDDTELQAGAN